MGTVENYSGEVLSSEELEDDLYDNHDAGYPDGYPKPEGEFFADRKLVTKLKRRQ